MKTLAIIGAGHLGQQIAHYAISDNHYQSVVFFDDFATQEFQNGYQILGTTQALLPHFSNKTFDELIIGVGYKHLDVRKELFQKYFNHIPFATIIHSSCWVDKTAKVNTGSVIYPNCTIDANATIENNTILNISCSIAHDSVIGAHSFLSPRVAVAGFVTIHEQTILGINSTIIDSISIAPKTQIGGGAVVIKTIQESGLYVGNPARFIR